MEEKEWEHTDIVDLIHLETLKEIYLIRQKASKNQLKLIAEITHAVKRVFNKYYH